MTTGPSRNPEYTLTEAEVKSIAKRIGLAKYVWDTSEMREELALFAFESFKIFAVRSETERNQIVGLGKTVQALLDVLPDNCKHEDDQTWMWAYQELSDEAQEAIQKARREAVAAVNLIADGERPQIK